MLNLNLLRVFHAVALHRSVVRAAESLYISQPAVSNALKKLQGEGGGRLFRKSGRAIVLTEHGEALQALAVRLFAVEREIEAFLNRGESGSPTIRIGLPAIYERFGVGEIVRDLSGIDGGLSVSVSSGNSATVLKKLEDRLVDLAVSGYLAENKALLRTFYRRHEVFLIAPKGHRLYGKKQFSAPDVQGERMILKEPGSSARVALDVYVAAHGLRPEIVVELSNIDSILSLAKSEQCLTFLPDKSVSGLGIPSADFSAARAAEGGLFFLTYVISHPPEQYAEPVRSVIERFHALVAEQNEKPPQNSAC